MIGSERLVCLDFSLDRLAAVEVADGQVVRWTVEPILAGSLRGGDPVDREQLAGELKSALARARIGAKKARIAISDDAAVVRVIDVPRIPKRHMAGAIRYLSEQETPFPQGRASLAWDIVERRQSTVRVYLAAAWRDVVQRLADVVRAAGLDPQVIEPRSLAIIRAVGQEQAIVLDAGQAVARLTYVSRTETPFTDQIPVLGDGEWVAANVMLGRALRGHRGEAPPVLLAGTLEAGANTPESEILAPLGLAIRGTHGSGRARYPEVNLLAGGDASRQRLPEASSTAPSKPRRRLVIAVAAVVVVAIWSVVGVGVASLLGGLPHLPLGP